jgi:hypothetical protein
MTLKTSDLGNIICPFCGAFGEDTVVFLEGANECSECGARFDKNGTNLHPHLCVEDEYVEGRDNLTPDDGNGYGWDDGFMDFYDYEPSPYDGTYSEM